MASASRVSSQERATVLAALSSALKNVSSLDVEGGVLAQAWMPEGEELRLHTKGLPFSLTGSGDLLALFRCLSCKFTFSIDLQKLPLMGSPGRVFSTGEAETSDNVQQCDVDIYLRNKEAKACRIFSTIHLPLFGDASRSRPVAVLEITQFKGSSNSYQAVFDWSRIHLQAAGVYLPHHMETQTFEMQSHAMSIRFSRVHESAFGELFARSQAVTDGRAGSTHVEDVTDPAHITSRPALLQSGFQAEAVEQSTSSQHRQTQKDSSGEGSEGYEEDPAGMQQGNAQDGAAPATEAYGKSMLTKSDLEDNFAFSLSEAAKRLGVSNTTVKRACRRYGIARWPRQEIMKAAAERDAAAKASAIEAAIPITSWGPSLSLPGSFPSTSPVLPFQQLPARDQQFSSKPSFPARGSIQPVHLITPGAIIGVAGPSSSAMHWDDLQGNPTTHPSIPAMSLTHQSAFAAGLQGHQLESAAPKALDEEGLDDGDVNLDSLVAMASSDLGALSDWPTHWSMDLDDKKLPDLT